MMAAWIVWARCCGAGALLAGLAAVTPAAAVTVFQKSAYTTIDLAQCTASASHADSNAHLCQGLDDTLVYLAEGDGRTYLSAGLAPHKTQAATQTLAAVNSPVHSHGRATLEWRFTIKNSRRVPYALIVRYVTTRDGTKGEVLIVTRITSTEACHLAYIDALANPDAILLARRIADARARASSCPAEPAIEGTPGQSPM